MRSWLRFVAIGLILGLFTEVQLKLVAGVNPPAFLGALFFYPIILTAAYGVHRLIERWFASTWNGDVVHYLASGIGGLAVEWGLLGNGPGSNAFQFGMFAMWTTFCFGPRVLTRDAPLLRSARRWFWLTFAVVALVLTAILLGVRAQNARVVIAVIGLSGTYMLWSAWLLVLAWRSR